MTDFQTEDQVNIKTIESQFSAVFDDLISDIGNVDIKISEIQRYITLIDSNISTIEKRIQSEPDPNKKIVFQKILNRIMELMVMYQDAYQKFIKIKHDYRKSQLTSVRDKIRLQLDCKKIDKSGSGELSVSELIKMFNSINNSNTDTDEIMTLLEEDESKDIYSLT